MMRSTLKWYRSWRYTGRTRVALLRRWWRKAIIVVEVEMEARFSYQIKGGEEETELVWRPLEVNDLHGRHLRLLGEELGTR